MRFLVLLFIRGFGDLWVSPLLSVDFVLVFGAVVAYAPMLISYACPMRIFFRFLLLSSSYTSSFYIFIHMGSFW